MQFDILFKVHEYQGTLMCLIILLVINLVSTTLKKYFYEYIADFNFVISDEYYDKCKKTFACALKSLNKI